MTRALEPLRRPRPFDAERDQSLRDPDAMPWSSTRFVLRRLAREDVAARRRANYLSLLDALADRVPAPFRSPSPGASPFLLPIETNEKAAVVDRLRRFGVDALDVWSVPHRSLPEGGFADARARRARTVGLPVHQELRPRDLERIAAAVG